LETKCGENNKLDSVAQIIWCFKICKTLIGDETMVFDLVPT